MNLKSQAKTQLQYVQMHKGKAIGSGVGLTAGVLYGLSSAKGKWGVVGFAIGGLIVGGIVGGLIDSNSEGNMVQVSSGDAAQSSFRGYTRGKTGINRPAPVSRTQAKNGLRRNFRR